MENIIVNGKEIIEHVSKFRTVADVATRFKPRADIYILNGMPVSAEEHVSEGDELVLITRGEFPGMGEIESMLAARHTWKVHNKLRKACVGIAGLGGLGSHVAVALTRMGVGKIVCADFDVVEPSNINRQYYFLDQIGMKKTEALKSSLSRISPLTETVMLDLSVDVTNARDIFIGCDVLVEAFDDVNSKIMLYDIWNRSFDDCHYVGASGISGADCGGIVIKKAGEKAYIVGDFEHSLGSAVLMAPKVGIVAHMQANLVVSIILEKGV